jgi:predicted DNA-binding protein
MHMSTLSRRTQLLLDEERHRRLEDEARRTGRSIGALVREAIDVRFDLEEEAERRRTAATELLKAPRPADPEPDWAEVERELLDSTALPAA